MDIEKKKAELFAILAELDAEIQTLRSRLEEAIRVRDGKIEALEKSVTFFKKRYHNTLKPRDKPRSETTDDESQGMQETAGEVPASPPIST